MIHKIALTIKPTMACNMKCRHCFNGDSMNCKSFIDIDTVFRFIKTAASENNDVKITFHGGEPTLAGYDFYKKIFEYEKQLSKEYNTVFSNFFTTNGVLLDEQFISLLVENDVTINISFDGPMNWVLRDNTELVINNIFLAQKIGAKLRIFCTVCNNTYTSLEDTYNWFKQHSLDFKILPLEPRGYAIENQSLIMDSKKFVEKLCDVYKIWLKDKENTIKIYTFQEFACLRRNVQFKPFWFNREIALNPNGKIYPFGRPNDVNYCLGKPTEINSLNDCFNSDEYNRLKEDIKSYWEIFCPNCESYHICNGVCLCMSYVYGDDEDMIKYSCNQSNHIFKNILDINDTIIQDFKYGNYSEYNNFIQKAFSEYIVL